MDNVGFAVKVSYLRPLSSLYQRPRAASKCEACENETYVCNVYHLFINTCSFFVESIYSAFRTHVDSCCY